MRVVSLSPTIRCLSCGAAVPRGAETCGECGANIGEQSVFALPLGYRIGGHYEIDYLLGRGGFGITYRAIDHQLGRYVAIKEFFPVEWAWRSGQDNRVSVSTADRAPFDKALQKFAEEGKILANLSHPNIVRIYTLIQEHNTLYLVMELLEGKTLAELIRTQGVPAEQVTRIARSLAKALHTIHKLGLQHLDIKPDNIMLTGDGRTVLFDFGAARWDLERGASRTRTIAAFTPGYAPLELLQASRARTSPATDIYELSVVIYEMLRGQLPPDPIHRLSIPDWEPDVPPQWKPLLQAGLQLQMADRPKTVADWWKLYDHTTSRTTQPLIPRKLPKIPFPFKLKHLRLPLLLLIPLAIAAFLIDPLLLPHRARQSVEQGNLTHAIALYNRAVHFAPHDPQLRQERAAVHLTLKNYRAAADDWEEAYRLAPSKRIQLALADAYFAWGEQLAEQGQRAEAKAIFDKAQEHNPGLADRIKARMMDALILNAKLAIQKGDFPGGISLYKEALLQDPHLPLPVVQHLRQNLADALRQQAEQQMAHGDLEGAIATLSNAIAENPNDPTLFQRRADALSKKPDYPKAIADYNRSIQLDQNLAPAYAGRAKLLEQQGKLRDALADYNKAIQLGSQTDTLYTAKGLILYQLQSFVDALKAFNASLTLNPRHAPALIGRGWTHFALQNYPAAINDFDQSLLYQESPAAHQGIGYAKTLLKDSPQTVLPHLQKAIELYQNQPDKIKEIQDWIKKYNLTH